MIGTQSHLAICPWILLVRLLLISTVVQLTRMGASHVLVLAWYGICRIFSNLLVIQIGEPVFVEILAVGVSYLLVVIHVSDTVGARVSSASSVVHGHAHSPTLTLDMLLLCLLLRLKCLRLRLRRPMPIVWIV